MELSMAELLNRPDASVALVGATDDPMKYGSVIYRNLKAKGITVYPVNDERSTVDGDPAYASLADLPGPPSIVNVVVSPWKGARIVREVAELGFDNVWFQPGAESPRARAAAEELGIRILEQACTMVVAVAR